MKFMCPKNVYHCEVRTIDAFLRIALLLKLRGNSSLKREVYREVLTQTP